MEDNLIHFQCITMWFKVRQKNNTKMLKRYIINTQQTNVSNI